MTSNVNLPDLGRSDPPTETDDLPVDHLHVSQRSSFADNRKRVKPDQGAVNFSESWKILVGIRLIGKELADTCQSPSCHERRFMYYTSVVSG